MKINNTITEYLFDTGASQSVISSQTFNKICLSQTNPPKLVKVFEDTEGKQILKCVIPHHQIKIIIQKLHELVFAGHLGLKRILK